MARRFSDLFSIIFFGSYGGLTHPGNLFFHAEKAFARNGLGHVLKLCLEPTVLYHRLTPTVYYAALPNL